MTNRTYIKKRSVKGYNNIKCLISSVLDKGYKKNPYVGIEVGVKYAMDGNHPTTGGCDMRKYLCEPQIIITAKNNKIMGR